MDLTSLKSLENFTKLVQKYGIFSLLKSTVLIFIFGIVAVFFLNQDKIVTSIITNYDKGVADKHNDQISYRNKIINPIVNNTLTRLLAETKADRAFVMEVHDGVSNSAGIPFTFADLTYEILSQKNTRRGDKNGRQIGIPSLALEFERIKLSMYELPYYLQDNSIWMGTIDDLYKLDSKMGAKMEMGGDKYIYVIGLSGKRYDIGLICLSFVKTNPGFDQQTLSKLIDASQRISGVLDAEHDKQELPMK